MKKVIETKLIHRDKNRGFTKSILDRPMVLINISVYFDYFKPIYTFDSIDITEHNRYKESDCVQSYFKPYEASRDIEFIEEQYVDNGLERYDDKYHTLIIVDKYKLFKQEQLHHFSDSPLPMVKT